MSPTLSGTGQAPIPNEIHRFFDLSPDLLAIAGTDGYFKRLNPAWERALGYPISELLSAPLTSFIHPDDVPALEHLQGRDRNRYPTIRNFTNRYRRRDGDYIWLEWTAHHYPQDNVSYCVARDVTVRKQAEVSLIQSQEAYQRLADTAPVLIWIAGQDKRCYFFNHTWLEFRGRALHEEIGDGWAEGVHQEDYHRCLETYAKAFDARQFFDMEYRLQRADGQYRWMLDIGVPNYASDGTFLGYLGTCVDIHERKMAEAALRRSESTLRDLLNGSQDMAFLTDEKGYLKTFNDPFASHFGKPYAELVSSNFYDLLSPDEAQHCQSRAERAVQTKMNIREEMIFGDRVTDYTIHPLVSQEGTVTGLAHFAHDITHLKATEAALRQNEDQFANVLESAAESILLTSQDGKIVLVNRRLEAEFGYTREELIGETVEMLLPEVHRSLHVTHRNRYAAHPSTRPMGIGMELYGQRKDGTVFPIEVSLSHIQNNGSSLMMALITNITERKHIEQSRLETQQLRDELEKERELIQLRQQFTSMVSHEFRTPLTAIATTCEILDRYYDRQTESQRRERVQGLKSQVLTMLNLLDDMLALNKIQAKAAEFHPTAVDVVALCKRVIETVGLADRNQHPLRLIADDDIPLVQADSHLLEHMLMNLLSNAMKYSPADSPVHLRLTSQADIICFEVQDFGRGIPEIEQARLFEAFFRARNVRDVSGTGLGLVIVKNHVELHGGTINFESAEGQGTTFRVELPINHPDGDTGEHSS